MFSVSICWIFFIFVQPGALVPLVGETGDKETLPGHLGLSSPHCHRLPWLPQLQVSLVFVVFVLCISEHFLTMGAVCKRLGKSEFIEVRNSSRMICAAFRLLFHLHPSAYQQRESIDASVVENLISCQGTNLCQSRWPNFPIVTDFVFHALWYAHCAWKERVLLSLWLEILLVAMVISCTCPLLQSTFDQVWQDTKSVLTQAQIPCKFSFMILWIQLKVLLPFVIVCFAC